ncbi:uncharacterized protein BCR38DRAFT_128472 [Pseudomassariella vexata]|uniref:Glycosyl transferase CAP10 domain-containing protein n=1 Tax=Pseudomassariella vexata TaxID=1141098 RepID=A0A1Y2EAD4_9PEZI|nr:uncharacterized protein BCR38DRAFT_128472 [Pseudomassariella vexata]ORY68216.1 hypothetical protein BCR38DRAFT_128472 [Pseudomassariella vexata]
MRSPAFPPRRPSHLVRYILPAAVLITLFYYLSPTTSDVPPTYIESHGPSSNGKHDSYFSPGPGSQGSKSSQDSSSTGKTPSYNDEKEKLIYDSTSDEHPIDSLIRAAESDFTKVLAKESHSLAAAAAAYREQRGRHPPPGFDAWYEFAKERNAVMIEDFWDQIYHDLNPFWGLDPKRIRKEAWDYEMTINIRNGNASAVSDWFWTQIWLDMIKTIEHLLPDMDIALNAMDEPRLVVPWEDINGYVQQEKKSRSIVPTKDVVTDFNQLPGPKQMDKSPKTRNKKWEGTEPYWLIARRGCPPDSLARTTATMKSFDRTPEFTSSYANPHQYRGYVYNSTLSREFCHQPDLQGLEGIFIKPLTTAATKVLFPMFGGSKLATNNEILLPAPMYWNEEERFTGGGDRGAPWNQKVGDLIWRGVATGGRNKEKNWKGFQRHRFVAMNNGTKLTRAEAEVESPKNFELPSPTYDVQAQKDGRLGKWVDSFADVGFTDLFCDDTLGEQEWGRCPYTDPEYEIVPGRMLSEQFDYKYLPDIDGNSFSGRYLGFVRSTSLPIKSTLFREWHDSRLVAWKHFVPMDNRFGDYYGIMEYFLGYGDDVPGHDAEAEKIATDGSAWAEKVLRREDMQIYTLRLLLEYARISDDRREKMGYVDDLL